MMNVRWAVGTKTADLIAVVEGVYGNYPTISKSIAEFWNQSKKDQEAVDETPTLAHIPRYNYGQVHGIESIDLGQGGE